MNTALIPRPERPRGAPVIPASLYAKRKPTWRERWFIRRHTYSCLISLTIMGLAITAGSVWDGIIRLAAICVLMPAAVASGVTLIVCILVFDSAGSGRNAWLNAPRRRRIIHMERQRLGAPHNHERALRARDVVYDQFSVKVERQEYALAVLVTQHTDWSERYGVYCKTQTTRRQWGADSGEWAYNDGYRLRLNKPTLDELDKAIEQANEAARQMEEQSYKDALVQRKLDRLALIAEAPPSGARDRAVAFRDEIEDELELV